MDFLDPKKQRQNTIVLYAGYLLIGIAIIISTIVLLYQANGYEVDNKGKLVQNGLVFFSSQPNPATIYLNDKKQSQQTNSRVSIPAGQYSVRLARAGYHDWQHTLSVQGGDVQHFDYPFLVPKTLAPKAYGTAYASVPALVSQSRDKRWLMVQPNSAEASFDIYDLKNPTDPAVNVTIPAEIVATSNGAATWKVVAWADDNQHVLLSRNDASGTAYIMLNRAEVAQSKNLTTLFNLSSGSVLTLNNNKFDQYYLHVPATGELSAVSLSTPTPAVVIKNVQAFKTYDNSTVLYATTTGAPAGKVAINMFSGGQTFFLRYLSAGSTYLLDMAGYGGTPYVVLGSAADNSVYIYKNPEKQLRGGSKNAVAMRAIRLTNPQYLAFSPTAQYILVQSGQSVAVYDIFQQRLSNYKESAPVDAPQTHATWMDGHRLVFVSGGTLLLHDFDQTNLQTLMAAAPDFAPAFSPDYHYVYTLAPATGGMQLLQTPLLTPADL